jgi:Tol biopolymer transport system component
MFHSRYLRLSTVLLPLAMLAALLAVVASDPAPADASVPGTNGKIVYARLAPSVTGTSWDLWTMNPDGTGQAALYEGDTSNEWAPAWSPDGTKIAFTSDMSTVATPGDNTSIWVMNADGSNATQITTTTDVENLKPQWSPDGQWILFEQLDAFELSGTTAAGTTGTTLIVAAGETFQTKGVEPEMEISVTGVPLATKVATVVNQTTLTVDAGVLTPGLAFTITQDRYFIALMKPDGSGYKNLSTGIAVVPTKIYSDLAPAWSPKGDKIAFASWREGSVEFPTNDIFVADINPVAPTPLTGLTNLTPNPAWYDSSEEPEWSPDGTKLVFTSQRTPGPGTDLWVQLASSTAGPSLQLTDTTGIEGHPTWSPDGVSIAFNDAGNLFSVPSAVAGGVRSQLTSVAAMDRQPDFNRALVATNDSYAVPTGGSGNQAAPGVMANDVGLGGNPLVTATVVAGPTHAVAGSFALSADGSFTYTHDGSAMDDSFTYKVTDAGGYVSNIATVTIDTPFNAPPVANPDMYTVDSAGTLTVPAPGVLGNDTDAEDTVPGTAVLVTGPAHNVGAFTLNSNGSFTYTHDGSAGTSDSFTYQAKDSGGKLSNVTTVTITITITGGAVHTVGLVDPGSGKWYLYDSAGVQKASFFYGNPGDYPIYGDWDGDGVETPGLYRQSDGYVYLRNSNTQGNADIKFFFGDPGDVPIAGDFNNDGFDTVSIYRPSNQTFYIINKLGSGDQGLGAADLSYVFGNPGDKPFVGDFDGDGVETAGLHRESTGLVYFRNSHTQGNADAQFIFGDPGDRLIAGDWTADGTFTPALFRPSNTTMYFRHTNTQGNADDEFIPIPTNASWLPIAGKMN